MKAELTKVYSDNIPDDDITIKYISKSVAKMGDITQKTIDEMQKNGLKTEDITNVLISMTVTYFVKQATYICHVAIPPAQHDDVINIMIKDLKSSILEYMKNDRIEQRKDAH